MNKFGRIAGGFTALGLVISLQIGNAEAGMTTIFDPTIASSNGGDNGFVRDGTGGRNGGEAQSYSQIRDSNGGSSGNNYKWQDSSNGGVSTNYFNTGDIEVHWSGTDVSIYLNTSMPLEGVVDNRGKEFGIADLFFDFDLDNTFDAGLDINNGYGPDGYGQVTETVGGKQRIDIQTGGAGNDLNVASNGRLVYDPLVAATAAGPEGFQQTKICSDVGANACTNVPGREPEVEVLSGTIGGTYDIVDTGQSGVGSSQNLYKIVLDNVNTDGSWDNFRLFWATAWCANDTVEGIVERPVPVPAALPMLLAAVGGVGFASWRRRKA